MPRIGASCFRELNPRTAFATNWNVRVIAAKLATLRSEGIDRTSFGVTDIPDQPTAPGALLPKRAAADIDRRLAEAEFHLYIGLYCRYSNRNNTIPLRCNDARFASPAIPLIDRFGPLIGENTPLFVGVEKSLVSI
jgi:hypothetical protein